MWPKLERYGHRRELVDLRKDTPPSQRAWAGFLDRASRGRLRFDPKFLEDLSDHVESYASA